MLSNNQPYQKLAHSYAALNCVYKFLPQREVWLNSKYNSVLMIMVMSAVVMIMTHSFINAVS
jgi:hypothetical protein